VFRPGTRRDTSGIRGVGRGNCPPGPNPKPDVQVSKYPAFQMILVSLLVGFEPVTIPAKRLDIVQAVGLLEVGEAMDGFDMIRV